VLYLVAQHGAVKQVVADTGREGLTEIQAQKTLKDIRTYCL
jgi:hypothetical protein